MGELSKLPNIEKAVEEQLNGAGFLHMTNSKQQVRKRRG